ncbi:hypothetical protein DFH11DRAFT_511967 [Phellopilus nigrolimitatus]|nr:hypothetical protein DFH11DRAFT_511967 [Phellopilus nigrolimitatus]
MTTDTNNTPPQTEAPDAEDERVAADIRRGISASLKEVLEEIQSVMAVSRFAIAVCKSEHDAVLRRIGEESLRSQPGQEQVLPRLHLIVNRTEEDLKITKDELAEHIRREELESRVLAGTRNMKQMTQGMIANIKHEYDAMLQHIGKVSCDGQHVHTVLLAQARWAEELLRSNTRSAMELASREEIEENALARTRDAVQLARTAVADAQYIHDSWLRHIGKQWLENPQGCAQVSPELREMESKAEMDLNLAEDEHFCIMSFSAGFSGACVELIGL